MEMLLRKEPHERVYAQGSGLAAWLLAWIRTSLRVKITGIGKARAKPHLELVELLQLGGKRQLMLVRCDGERYLLGAGEDGIHSIVSLRTYAAMDNACNSISATHAGDLLRTPQRPGMKIRCSY